jgi:SAM-dependent methyltransferase
MTSEPYQWLAKHYDSLREFRRPLHRPRAHVLGPIMPNVESACDLGCGTGDFALALSKRGVRTFGIDLSPEMCRILKRKARQEGTKVEVLCADMRSFRIPVSVDLVTCEFDALNHVPRKQDLPRVLRSAARALKPGGIFAFDVNNRLAFERLWTRTWFVDQECTAAVLRGEHVPGTDEARIQIDWFLKSGQTWKRQKEAIREVCWSATEIRTGLRDTGFKEIRSWDAAQFFDDEWTRPGNRTFWRARKAS